MKVNQSNIERKLNNAILSFIRKSQSRVESFHLEVKESITYDEFLSDKMLMIAAIRAGIPYSLFDLIQLYTPFTENDWAQFLDISTKSLHRYKTATDYNFKPIHSEKIIEMAEVTKIGLDVFEDTEKLRLWLNTPNYALGKLKPIELLKDSYGKELVVSELIRINHGILV
jgi:putative toxin-antitoxin system antitoxin component (TIGR02293 family)